MPLTKHRPNLAEIISTNASKRKSAVQRQRTKIVKVINNVNIAYSNNLGSKRRKPVYNIQVKPVLENEELTIETNAISGTSSESDFNTKIQQQQCDDEAELLMEENDLNVLYILSGQLYKIVESKLLRILLVIFVLLAFVCVTYFALDKSRHSNHSDRVFVTMEFIIDVFFAVTGFMKLLSLFIYVKVFHRLHKRIETSKIINRCGLLDITLSLISISFGNSYTSHWSRLCRLFFISIFALEELPHIEVLVSGITFGIRSIVSTWLLLTLVFFCYASCTMTFFGKNDPYHFETLAMSMWTLFHMSTFDNWSDILRINMYGCDKYTASYYRNATSIDENRYTNAFYGSFHLPICDNPTPRPGASVVIFFSFIVICGYILISLTVAAVTAGINDGLDAVNGEDEIFDTRLNNLQFGPLVKRASSKLKRKSFRSTFDKFDPSIVLIMLKQVWKQDGLILYCNNKTPKSTGKPKRELRKLTSREAAKSGKATDTSQKFLQHTQSRDLEHVESFAQDGLSWKDVDMRFVGLRLRNLINSRTYKLCDIIAITAAALLEIYARQNPESSQVLEFPQIALQIMFTIDFIAKFMSCYPALTLYFENGWNRFDSVLVVVTWIPIIYSGGPIDFISLFRVLRILRLLKLLNWIQNLNIMLKAVSSSLRCIVYVILIVALFFFQYAVAGTLLFSQNDPFHFRDVWTTLVTLFQIATLDDWVNIATSNILGCDLFSDNSGLNPIDEAEYCDDPYAFGWVAAWYFAIFIIIGVFVLVSLFLGVIITAMDLLKEGLKEETTIVKKVKTKQSKYNLSSTSINTMLEIFDMIDVEANGKLSFQELKPLLTLVKKVEQDSYETFLTADSDASGQLDFAEFIDLVMDMRSSYRGSGKNTPQNPVVIKHIASISSLGSVQEHDGEQSPAVDLRPIGASQEKKKTPEVTEVMEFTPLEDTMDNN